MTKIDAIQRALELRKTLVQDDKILVVDFSSTMQGKDTSRVIDLMPNIATGDYIFRAKVNIKEIDPFAAEKYNVPFHDIKKMTDDQIEELVKRKEFDFPLWYKHDSGFAMQRVPDLNYPFIYQIGGCNFHDGSQTGGCWYCFVDDKSNDGEPQGKVLLAPEETVSSMVAAREKIKGFYEKHRMDVNIRVLRASGGEPTVALDHLLATWRAIERAGYDFVGQLDSNLSTGSVVDRFEQEGIYEPNTLEKLAQFPIKVLTAIKGTDETNLEANVQSTTSMAMQLYSIKKFLKAGFDIYPQMYNPNPETLEGFLKKMDRHIKNFSMRVHIGPLKMYGPNSQRLTFEAEQQGIEPKSFIEQKKKEWDDNYKQGVEIADAYLRKAHGVGYKDMVRSDVDLKLINPIKRFFLYVRNIF